MKLFAFLACYKRNLPVKPFISLQRILWLVRSLMISLVW